jgi:hypothetical protein
MFACLPGRARKPVFVRKNAVPGRMRRAGICSTAVSEWKHNRINHDCGVTVAKARDQIIADPAFKDASTNRRKDTTTKKNRTELLADVMDKTSEAVINPPSPYELRNPDWDLPRYALKKAFFPVLPNKRVCFVHVGKTAGSKVGYFARLSTVLLQQRRRTGQIR